MALSLGLLAEPGDAADSAVPVTTVFAQTYSVSPAGDVNGDDHPDFMVGEPLRQIGPYVGWVHVYFGGPGLDSLADWALWGGHSFGFSVGALGDINGDGYDDIAVGMPSYDGNRGRVAVYFGGASPDTTPDVVILGQYSAGEFGSCVGSAGDVNGDGHPDFFGSAPKGATNWSAGRVRVFWGGPGRLDGTADWVLNGAHYSYYGGFGTSVSSAGDFNGDGYGDLLVGDPDPRSSPVNPPSRALLYFGGNVPDTLADRRFQTGFVAPGYDFTMYGRAVACAGDVNADGYPDILVGSPYGDVANAFLYLGGASPDTTADAVCRGGATSGNLGYAVGTAGDVNGDGFSDFLVGDHACTETHSWAGEVQVHLGGSSPDGNPDIRILGCYQDEQLGIAVGTAGDLNSDGRDEMLAGRHNRSTSVLAWSTAPPPACGVSPVSLDFGTVWIGDEVDRTFAITNSGGGTLCGTIPGNCGSSFTVVSGAGSYSLIPGQSHVVTVRIYAWTEGVARCTLEVRPSPCADVVCVAVVTQPPSCAVSPSSLNFGTVLVGATSDLSFTISNSGGGTLDGAISETCADYSIVSGGGAYSLGTGQSRIVTVRFAPTTLGSRPCTIATGSALCGDVMCAGTGATPCSITPDALDFGTVTVGSTRDLAFTISNSGGGTLDGAISETCADYSIVSGGGAYSLGAGQSRIVTVRFAPTSAGAHPCTIETGSALCSDVTCAGIGELAPACAVSPASLDFGTVQVGSEHWLYFTISNTGGGTLQGAVSEACADYNVFSGGGAFSLGAGQSREVGVRFSPTAAGTRPCTIETGSALCVDVACTGVGQIPTACAVSPTTLDFGTVTVGGSRDLSFTIANSGGGTLAGTVSEVCDPYSIVSGGGAYSLVGGQMRTITVRFAPTAAGDVPCSIETGNALCSDVSCMGAGEIPVPGNPDPGHSTAAPWDAIGIARVSPGTQSGYDLVTVQVRDSAGTPVPAANVAIQLLGCFDLCIDSVEDGLTGVTDASGVAHLDPRVGGCDSCVVRIVANGFVLREYARVVSPDWDGTEANGSVGSEDYSYFEGEIGRSTPCADLDHNGTVSLVELSSVLACLSAGDENEGPCRDPMVGADPREPSLAAGIQLSGHPNPFSDGTTIRFVLPAGARVSLTVRDVAGRTVRSILHGEMTGAGAHSVAWDGTNAAGSRLPGGIYLCTLEVGRISRTVRVALLR
jgi:hypothetical protein